MRFREVERNIEKEKLNKKKRRGIQKDKTRNKHNS